MNLSRDVLRPQPMTFSRGLPHILTTWCAAWIIVGCRQIAPANFGSTDTATTITVSAAASLQDALEIIDPMFEDAHPAIQVDYNFASSGALQRQIEQGAPVDVFFSAAAKPMDALEERDLIRPETRRNLVANRLVLITSDNSDLGLTSLEQLKANDVRKIAVGEFRSVPAGQYAKEAMETLGILKTLQSKFVFGANVRGVLAAVESGYVNAGLVYATDAALSDSVRTIAVVAPETHSAIVYPIAVLTESAQGEAAIAYINFLSSRQAQAIFAELGFELP